MKLINENVAMQLEERARDIKRSKKRLKEYKVHIKEDINDEFMEFEK